jgi:hypothetical protein
MKILLIILLFQVLSLKIDELEVNRMPSLNLRIDDKGGDPVNFKRFNTESKEYSRKADDLYLKYQSDKDTLIQVANSQMNSITNLSNELEEFYNLARDLNKLQ